MTESSKLDRFEIKIDIFNCVVTVFLGDFAALREFLRKRFNIEMAQDDSSVDGFLADLDKDYGISGQFVLAIRNFYSIKKATAVGILAHESLHATRAIFRSRGIPFAGDNEETIAYIQEYIVESILKKTKLLEKNEEDA